MPENVRINAFLDARFDGRLLDGFLNRRVGVSRHGRLAGEQIVARSVLAPVQPQFFQEPGRERHEPLFASLSARDS